MGVVLNYARHWVFLIIACVLATGGAQAQTGRTAVSGLSEQFEDWTVQCAEANGIIVCTMQQDVRPQGQAERLVAARIDLLEGDMPRLTLILPLGLDLEAGIELFPGTSQAAVASLSPRVCQQSECYAFMSLAPDFLQTVSERIALRIRMTPFNGQAIEVPLSLRGFSDALEMLNSLQE